MSVYIKVGSRYKEASLGDLVGAIALDLYAVGEDDLAKEIVEKVISRMTKLSMSKTDIQLVTQHVIQELKR